MPEQNDDNHVETEDVDLPTEETSKTLEEFKSEDNNEGQLMRAYLGRREGKCVLYLQVAEEVEKFFSSGTIDESEEWHGGDGYHEFYYKDYSEEFEKHLEMKNDKFGGNYIKDKQVNIALLRTVGLSDGVEFELPGDYSEESLLDSMKELKEEVEIMYKQYIRPVQIRSSLSIVQT